jgi:hypothetical protein
MKDKVIGDFENYVKSSNIKGFRLRTDFMKVQIIPTFWNDRTFTDIGLVALAAYATYSIEDKSFYLIPILLGYTVLMLVIWYDFRRINLISIDLNSKKMEVVSRNVFQRLLIKYLFRGKWEYDFNEIASFITESNSSSKADLKKYFIKVKLKNRDNRLLFGLAKEGQANTVAAFLTGLTIS